MDGEISYMGTSSLWDISQGLDHRNGCESVKPGWLTKWRKKRQSITEWNEHYKSSSCREGFLFFRDKKPWPLSISERYIHQARLKEVIQSGSAGVGSVNLSLKRKLTFLFLLKPWRLQPKWVFNIEKQVSPLSGWGLSLVKSQGILLCFLWWGSILSCHSAHSWYNFSHISCVWSL